MDIEKVKLEFIKYVNNYDQENRKILLKKSHSFRVMEISNKIAQNLDLSKDDIDLATLIGLLHDIARFEQMKRFGTYVDSKSVDHGDLGAEILSDKNFLRKFIEEDKYDDIIITAVRNHNKYKIQDGLQGKALLHSKIIRDADKIDILYEATENFWYTDEEIKKIEESEPISQEYFDQIKNHKQIFRKKETYKTELNNIIIYICFVFDINFKCSIEMIYEKNYINDILNKFKFKNENSKIQIENIRNIINEYMLEMIKID